MKVIGKRYICSELENIFGIPFSITPMLNFTALANLLKVKLFWPGCDQGD